MLKKKVSAMGASVQRQTQSESCLPNVATSSRLKSTNSDGLNKVCLALLHRLFCCSATNHFFGHILFEN